MNIEEFLVDRDAEEAVAEPVELDVQRAVVESLAADKAMQNEEIAGMQAKIAELQTRIAELQTRIAELQTQLGESRGVIADLQNQVADLNGQLVAERDRQFEIQSRNPNALALLDREVELPDRFPGESRDHVLEALRKERDLAESEGRLRCAQVLEGVLVVNEPNGELQRRRSELKRLLEDNSNVINGTVIAGLTELGISYKDGDKYLLASEIMKRAY